MTQAGPTVSASRRSIWAGPLLAGACFGLAYGVSHRLLALNVGELIRFGQGFDVQVFPGTSLESLRLRFGTTEAEVRGNLELQQLERQQEEQKPAAQPDEPAVPAASSEEAPEAQAGGMDGASESVDLPPEPATPPAGRATPPSSASAPPPVRP